MTGPHDTIRRRARDCGVVVFDLDGVIREFGPATTEAVAADLGLTADDFLALAFAPDLIEPVVTGQRTFAGWCGLIRDALVARDIPPAAAEEAVTRWVADRGVPVAETVELMRELEEDGAAVFVFTNGTDNIPAELRQIGLDHLVDVVLNSAVLGHRKPHHEAYARAHAALESHLGRAVRPDEVLFTDDRPDNIDGAIRFGWQAVHFDAGVRTDV
ncbi:HAD-IA family hydrolase [Ornithinimicrobium sp. F0845]|uniref:HAD family hydrolase n=1 Tax=Ornithinimicrobium sp. F0845 TaxID=2926412 RepID=UPI001FF10D1D|nr:HAD-IA family hydrolase [Ornithinimicrobium sp. F0845]MCK0113600.1 HAD-IA family hydrolase [Ornithinimicrobium sp. F0845]